MKKATGLLLVGFFALVLSGQVEARPKRVDQIPNGDINRCANCHVNPAGGGARNDFGQMIEREFLTTAGFSGDVVWASDLPFLDADGDGITNGEELGDPNGAWQLGDRLLSDPAQVSLPGSAESVPGAVATLPDGTTAPLPPLDGTTAPLPPLDGTTAPLPPLDGTTAPLPPLDGTTAPLPPLDGTTDQPSFGGLPPEVIELLLSLEPKFKDDPGLILAWVDVVPNAEDASNLERITGLAELTGEALQRLLEGGGDFLPGDGQVFDQNIEEVRGVVGDFDVVNGVLRLQSRLMPIAAGAVLLDGNSGRSIDVADLDEGDHLVVRALWTKDLVPVVVEAVRNGEPPLHAPSLWVQFEGLTELEDGTPALVTAGKELLVAFDAPVFSGEVRAVISQDDIGAGDRVALRVRYDNFGAAVIEVHVDPPAPVTDRPGEPMHEPFWDLVDRVYDIDQKFRQVRFELESKLIDENTEFFDAFGFEIGPEDLFPDDELAVWLHNPTRTAIRVEIRDRERHYDFEPDPEIGFYFGSFARFDENAEGQPLLIMYDPYWKPISLDAVFIDEETEEDLTGEVGTEDLIGEFVRARIRHQQPGEEGPGDLIVAIGLNPSERPLAPGERPVPTEFFGEWDDLGVLAHVDLEARVIVRAGITVLTNGDTEVLDNDTGTRLFVDQLQPGDYIMVDPLATSDPTVVLAREIRINPFIPDEGLPSPVFTTEILGIDGDRIMTAGGSWIVEEGSAAQPDLVTELFDGETGDPLALEDFGTGDLVNIRIQHTNVGDLLLLLERNPRIDRSDQQWDGDWEIFAVDRETGEVRFAGPSVGFVSRTRVFNRQGREISLEQIPLGEPIVINQAPSATGGPPIARSVEIQNFDTFYDGPNFFFTNFAGVEGDQILTVDHPRFLAIDAEFINGNIGDLQRGTRVRALIKHPLAGLNSPFGDVITRLEINPQFGGEAGFRAQPVETGDISGRVVGIDLDARTLELEPTVVRVDLRTELVDAVNRTDLVLEDLVTQVDVLVAVNISQEFDGRLFGRRVTLLDPLRVPTPRPELIVAPLQAYDPATGEILLQGLVARVTDEDTQEIRLADGSLGGLEDIQVGDGVRLQIVEVDDGAVASRIKVSGGFSGPIFGGGGLEIISTFPEPGEAFVPLRLGIEVTFNEAVRGLLTDKDFDIGLFPPVDFELDLSRDGRTMILTPVQGLTDDTVYQLFVKSGRFGRYTLNFTTADALPQGGILGLLETRDIPFELIAPEESGVFLLSAEILGDFFADAAAGEVLDPVAEEALFEAAFVAAAPFDQNGVYRFDHIPDGDYFIFATVVLEFGPGKQLALEAYFDRDGDGDEDFVEVRGDLVDRVDLTVTPPEPLFVEETFPIDGATGVDELTAIEIAFSEPLRTDFRGLPIVDGVIFPKPLSGQLTRADLVLSAEGFAVSAAVELAEDTNYSLMLFNAENAAGLGLEEPVVVHFSTGAGGGGIISGQLSLPEQLPAERVIQRPALLALIPFRDFDPFNPDIENFAVAGALSFDGSYQFEGVPSGRHVVMATVDVALPPYFRLASRGLIADPRAFEQVGRFGPEVPAHFVDVNFFGFSQDNVGDARDDVRDGSADVDILLKPEDVRRSGLRVVRVDPSPEDLRQAPEVVDIAIEFSEPLIFRRNFIELKAFIRPEPLSGPIMRQLDITDDGQRIVFRDIQLEQGTAYRLSIPFARGISGQELAEPFNLAVLTAGTEELVLGSVSGEVRLTGDEINEAAVFLYDPQDEHLEAVAGALVETDGTFLVEDVVGGVYAAYLELKTVGGQDLLLLYDGEPFIVDAGVAAGIDFEFAVAVEQEIPAGEPAQLTLDAQLDLSDEVAVAGFKADFVAELAASLGIDPSRIAIVDLAAGSVRVTFVITESADASEPAASEVVQGLDGLVSGDLGGLGEVVSAATAKDDAGLLSQTGPNAGALVTLDLDASAGDQALDKVELAAGETVSLSIYGRGLQDVTGVSISVGYDTAQVAFEEALAAGDGENNVLASQVGAIPLFLPVRIRESTSATGGATQAEFGGAILSPTASTAAVDQGLLGVLRFTALEGYSGATLTLNQVIFNSLGGVQDTIISTPTVLVTPPLDLLSVEKGIFSFDFDLGPGTLFHRGETVPGEEVTIEVYVNDVSNLVNYSFKLLYDQQQLNYVTWSGANFLATAGGTAIELDPLVGTGIDVGGAILGPSATQAVSGSHLVGSFTFTTTAAFSETDLVISNYSTKAFGAEQVEVESSIFARLTTEAISSATAAGATSSDFDGDGVVSFGDFFLFADAFGATLPDLRYDLDGDSDIGFGDFFIFADAFGGIGKQVVADTGPTLKGGLGLEAATTATGVRLDLRSAALALRGYAAVVEYDPRAFRLESVSDRESALRGEDPALLLQEQVEGQVLLIGSRTAAASAVEGLLAQLHFAPLYPEAEGVFRIRAAQVRGADGRFGQVLELGQVTARLAPEAFVLQANYPNPFNPATTIRYQVAAAAPVRLEIFDVLGQRVRTLVAETQSAGFHRVVWDSRDDSGRAVAAGIYLYRLQAGHVADRAYRGEVGSFSQVRKLLLLK